MAPPDLESVERLRAWVHQNGSTELKRALDSLIACHRSDRAELTQLRDKMLRIKTLAG